MISRRTFLKATVAASSGFIFSDWLIKAENYIEMEGEPFLEAPGRSELILYAMDWGGDEYQLSLGNPFQEPVLITWREYFEFIGCSGFDEYHGSNNPADWNYMGIDELVDEDKTMYHWITSSSPDARAFDYLESLNLGPIIRDKNEIGEIRFYDGVAPGNDSRIVSVPDDLSLSLLQKRLNQLDGGVSVNLATECLRDQVERPVIDEDIALTLGKRATVGLRWQASHDLEESYAGSGSDYRIRG